tara:strand:+ start:1921 stop:2151 length:231 start_codon:yes stop_codon:yes gene_type:complete
MFFSVRKLFFIITFNSSLFLILLIGIQNSLVKKKVNFVFNETIELPISFIVGSSFISGSILGSIVNLSSLLKNKNL